MSLERTRLDVPSQEPPTVGGVEVAPPPAVDIPGYDILGELGRGGMGVVYKARHRELNRVCALKMVLAGVHANDAQRERFLAEARAVAALQHPSIVPIYEIGQHQGLPYFTLEYVAGGTLTGRVRTNPLPARAAAVLVEQVARAVAYAHAHGIVHRDLKPDNILLTTEGVPRVSDFGLAKQTDGSNHLTASGAIVGTPSYMAPEQAEGKKEVGPHADVYALGAILYRLVTGRPPFQAATTMETLHLVIGAEPVPPGQLASNLPRDLETIILKCLRKEPARRYASAQALADDLARFLADEPILARPSGRSERAWRWCRKNPLAAATVALVGLVVTAAVVVPIIVASALSAEQSKTQAALKDARREAATSLLDRGLALCEAGEASEGLHWLLRGLEIAEQAEAGDLAAACRWNLAAWSVRVPDLVGAYPLGAAVETVALRPDDGVVVAGSRGGVVRQWRIADGQPAGPDLRHPDLVRSVAFVPAGTEVLTACADGVARVWDLATGEERLRLPHYAALPATATQWPFTRGVLAVAVSPDGRLAVTAGRDLRLRFWSLPTGEPVGLVQLLDHPFSLAFSADGRTLLVGAGWKVVRYDVASQRSGEPLDVGANVYQAAWGTTSATILAATMQRGSVELFTAGKPAKLPAALTHRGAVRAVGATPDGRWIVSGGEDQVVRWWDATTGKPGGPPLRHGGSVMALAIGRTRAVLATGAEDGAVRVWRLPDPWPGREIVQSSWARAVTFAPDGKQLLVGLGGHTSAGGSVVPHDTATGLPAVPVYQQPREGWVQGIALSPDGSRLYTTSNRPGRAVWWDRATGRELGATPEHGDQVWRLALSPDGTRLATGLYDYKPAPQGCSARLWDTATGAAVGEPLAHAGKVFGLAFSPDGATLLTGSHDRTLRRWDGRTGAALGEPRTFDAELWSVAYHPEGQVAALGFGDGTVRQWHVGDERAFGPGLRHSGPVQQVQYLAAGALLLTCSSDNTARVWHAATGKPVGPAFTHAGIVNGAAMHPAGHTLATGGDDRRVRLWPFAPAATESVPVLRQAIEARTNLTLEDNTTLRVLSATDWQERAGTVAVRPGSWGVPEAKPPTPPVVGRAPDPVAPQNPAVEPRRVTLRLEAVPLADAVAALAKASGLPLDLPARSDAVVSLDFKGVPAWQALDELRRQANHSAYLVGGRIVLGPGQGVEPGLLAYPGPFRLQVAGLIRLTGRTFGDQLPGARQPPESLGVTFNLASANAGNVVGVGHLQWRKITTETGEVLEPLGRTSPEVLAIGALPTVLMRAVGLPVPKASATRLNLEGALPVLVAGKPTVLAELSNLRTASRELFPLPAGRYVRVPAFTVDASTATVNVLLTIPEGQEGDPRDWVFDLLDGEHTLRGQVISTRAARPAFRPDDLLLLAPWSAAPYGALALRSQGPARATTFAVNFPLATPPSDKARLRLSTVEHTTVEIPFTFKDVPLPR